MRDATNAVRQEAIAHLRTIINPGDTVYTVLRSVSRSGMSRTVDVIKIDKDGNPCRLTHSVAVALDFTYDRKQEALKVQGCGMDAGFEVVYHLGRALFPEFICSGKDCRSNDHSNGDRDYTPHKHSDGGYALNHRWL